MARYRLLQDCARRYRALDGRLDVGRDEIEVNRRPMAAVVARCFPPGVAAEAGVFSKR